MIDRINIFENVRCQLSHWKNLSYYNEKRIADGNEVSIKEFDKHQTIFIHIPKTGGVSVSRALFGVRSGGHSKISGYKKIYGLVDFYRYYKFCFVRNPYTRTLSAYNYFKKGGYSKEDREIADEYFSKFDTFNEFVQIWLNDRNIWKIKHFHPQVSFITNRKKRIEVDFIGRFENFERDFNKVTHHLNVKAKLPHFNKSKPNIDWIQLYTDEDLKIVETVYKNDFDMLGYPTISKDQK